MSERLTPEREAEIAERTPKRAAALTAWLDRFSPVDGDQRSLENAETVLNEDVPALLAELAAVRAERDQAQARVAALEAVPTTVYRASHDSIVMGLYTTREAAMHHCEAHELRDDPVSPMFWRTDEDGTAELFRELVPRSPGAESATGFVVTPLEVAFVDADAPAWWPDADQRAHARETAAHAMERARLQAVAWLLVAAIHLDPTPVPEAGAR